ncbi:MAG: type 1 glutamine amidotransferase [Glaciecola sp.]|jgi:type 1 glutamine amidotransferase
MSTFRHLTAALLAGLLLAPLAGPTSSPASAQQAIPEVLVWGGAYGFRHPSITNAELAFQQLALETGAFNVRVTENPADLNSAVLQDVDVVVWVSTTGKPPFTQQQRDDIIRHAGCGGGTMAFHAAADSNYGWPEYAELLGVQFDSHPKGAGSGEARMIVEDNAHTITEGWAGLDDFMLDDEYYRWRATQGIPSVSLPRTMDDVHVLLSLDETTVGGDIQNGPLAYENQQPIAWTKNFRDAGRVYYNNMGHSDATWEVPAFRTSLVNGIDWVSQVRLDADCYAGSDPLPAPAGPPPPNPLLRGQACILPEVHERTGFTWQVSDPIRALTEEGDTHVLPSAGIPGNLNWGAQFYVLDLAASTC